MISRLACFTAGAIAVSCLKHPITNSTKTPKHKHNFIAEAVKDSLDSVVNISVKLNPKNKIPFQKSNLMSTGSGFVLTTDGTILTNFHVVEDMQENGSITVTGSDGIEYPGYLYSSDPQSDLAIIKLNKEPSSSPAKFWVPVKLGAKYDLDPGDWVVAIGSPFGLQNTVTAGVVSSRRRKNIEIGNTGNTDGRVDYIQTDCVVHSGSSGGPLLNLNGEVIGINTTRAESEGITFAIRIDNVMGIISQLCNSGKVVRPWLGLRMVGLTGNVWQQLKVRGSTEFMPKIDSGVLITSVFPNGPAEKGGLLEGDVVTDVNGKPVSKTHEILGIVGHETGREVILTINRNVPLDVDWDGRVTHYENQIKLIKIVPLELGNETDDIQEFLNDRIQVRGDEGKGWYNGVNLETKCFGSFPSKFLSQNIPAESNLQIQRKKILFPVLEGYDFRQVDEYAINSPQLSSLPELSNHLLSFSNDPILKLRAIYRWIAENIAYDVDGFFGKRQMSKQDAKSVFVNHLSVCEGYANIFCALAKPIVGVRAEKVSGYGRGFGSSPDCTRIPRNEVGSISNHAWNVVFIDGYPSPFFVESTWGSGILQNGSFKRQFSPFYFLMLPEVIKYSHFPENSRDSFFDYKLSESQFLALPFAKEGFFTLDCRMVLPKGNTLVVNDNYAEVEFECGKGFVAGFFDAGIPVLGQYVKCADGKIATKLNFFLKSPGDFLMNVYGFLEQDFLDSNPTNYLQLQRPVANIMIRNTGNGINKEVATRYATAKGFVLMEPIEKTLEYNSTIIFVVKEYDGDLQKGKGRDDLVLFMSNKQIVSFKNQSNREYVCETRLSARGALNVGLKGSGGSIAFLYSFVVE